MDDDNIFDEDNALDYIIYEEHEKTENNNKNDRDCFTILFFFLEQSHALGQ